MPNLREIPVKYIVDKARAQTDYAGALPYRVLIKDWFVDNHHEEMGNGDLRDIDLHFHKNKKVKMKMNLDGCVLGKFRTDAYYANMLVGIIEEIHRRMNIPREKSQKAQKPEDVRQDNWNWPLVMRLLKRECIISENTKKATFGALIEKILGNKVKPDSIRRTTRGNYDVVDKTNFELNDTDRDAYLEIFKLFVPLLKATQMPKN